MKKEKSKAEKYAERARTEGWNIRIVKVVGVYCILEKSSMDVSILKELL